MPAHGLRLTADKIAQRLRLIAPMVPLRRAPIERFSLELLPDASTPPDLSVCAADVSGGRMEWNAYWGGQDLHFVLRSRFTVPRGWRVPALHLPLGVAGDIFTHPEGLLYIDGHSLASADRYHHTIEVPDDYADGLPHDLTIHGWTGLSGWPPDPSNPAQLLMKECAVIDIDRDLEGFVTIAQTALDFCSELNDNRPEKHAILTALDGAFLTLDTRDPMGEDFRRSVRPAMERLAEGLDAAGGQLDIHIHAAGHAHMDVAYLWPVAQIRQKNARTYSNVLRLMDKHEGFTFSHSQPQLYAWTEEDFPHIFSEIRDRVAEGRWEVLGGMWVEPDANMPGPEALVRQIALARDYCEGRFGKGCEAPVLWLPDTFGFPGCLPQLMAQADLKFFVTNKVNWNQYNQMPASTTWWEGIDGSRVLAHFLTTPRDVQHLPFPTNYKSDLTAEEVVGTWSKSTVKDRLRDLLICYGYGDGGGGPTDELIRKAEAWENMPGAPRLRFSTVSKFFERVEDSAADLPTWQGEFYLEGHRGVLTSQGWIKRANRKAEVALHDVELAMALAIQAGKVPEDLKALWQRLCMLQFHDILTGTSIRAVFEDAARDFDWIFAELDAALLRAATHLGAPGADWTVLDGAPLPRARQILLDGPAAEKGTPLPAQVVADGWLVELPPGDALSARALSRADGPAPADGVSAWAENGGAVLESALLRVEIGDHGMIARLYDKAAQREVLKPGMRGNRLELFEDRPISWDAWDIDIFFEDRGELVGGLTRIEVVETGPLRAVVEVERAFRQSQICQRIVLRRDSKRLDFETEVDWHETHLLLKAAFPVDIRASRAVFDIQWGQIDRPTHRNTSWDAAQFEVPAQKWADLSEGDYGVALLNDCKYGYDVRGDVLRLSLIKSATMPDHGADQGRHVFTYSLLPHVGNTRVDVRAEAYALNYPPRVLPGGGTVLGPLIRCLSERAVIETIKPAEDGNGVVVRLFEAHNTRGAVELDLSDAVRAVERCGLLENQSEPMDLRNGAVHLPLRPCEIVTLRLIL